MLLIQRLADCQVFTTLFEFADPIVVHRSYYENIFKLLVYYGALSSWGPGVEAETTYYFFETSTTQYCNTTLAIHGRQGGYGCQAERKGTVDSAVVEWKITIVLIFYVNELVANNIIFLKQCVIIDVLRI